MSSPQLNLALSMILLPSIFYGEMVQSEMITKRVELDGIEHVHLMGTYDLTVSQGQNEYVLVTVDSEFLNKIEAKIQGNKLALGREKVAFGWTKDNKDFEVRFEVQVKELKSINNMGVGHVVVNDIRSDGQISFSNMGAGSFDIDSVKADKVEFSNLGAGKLNVQNLMADSLSESSLGAGRSVYSNIVADKIELTLIGSSHIRFTGDSSANKIKINTGGVTSVDAESLQVKKAEIEAGGASTVKILVTEDLDAEVNGNSNIFYGGEPTIKKSTNGVGDVKPLRK